MYYLQTKYAHEIRNKYINSKDHERKATRRPRVSGVQSDVTKSKSFLTRYLCDGANLRAVFSFEDLNRARFPSFDY